MDTVHVYSCKYIYILCICLDLFSDRMSLHTFTPTALMLADMRIRLLSRLNACQACAALCVEASASQQNH